MLGKLAEQKQQASCTSQQSLIRHGSIARIRSRSVAQVGLIIRVVHVRVGHHAEHHRVQHATRVHIIVVVVVVAEITFSVQLLIDQIHHEGTLRIEAVIDQQAGTGSRIKSYSRSTGQFVNWTVCQLDSLSTGQFVNWTVCLLDSLSTGHFVIWTFCQPDILST